MSESRLGRVRRWAGSGVLFGLVVGLIVGALVAAVAIPKRQPERVTSAAPRAGAPAEGGVVGEDDTADDSPAPEATGSGPGAEAPAGEQETGAATGSARDRSTAPATGPRGASSAAPAASTRGVTGNAVVVTITYPDLSALRALGPAYDNGDVPEQWRALVDGWRRQRLLPIHGRDIRLTFRTYNVVQPAEQRSACVGAIQDDRAFAVVGVAFFAVGSECVAREFRTPLITSDGPSDEVFARSNPNLFSLSMSESRMLRNLVHWAHARGSLRGQRIGLYYLDDPVVRDLMRRTVKAELSRLGHRVAAEATTGQALGGPQDALAVQRFRSAGVRVALLFTSKAGFMQQAEAQGYRPTYLESDYFFGTSDTTTSNYPQAHFDGTYGITGRRVGETRAGIPLGAEGEACLRNYQRFSGERPPTESAAWSYVLMSCDEGKALLTALRAAGRGLTPQSFVAGLETMRDVPMTRYAPVSFRPGKHHGGERYRTVRFAASCRCWKAIGDFKPLLVP